MRESVLQVTETPNYICIMASDSGWPIGVVDTNTWTEKGWWWVARVKVEERYRGSGIGSLMMIRLQKVLETRSDVVGLVVAPGGYGSDPDDLAKFYEKNGFVRDEKEKELFRWTKKTL